MDLRVVELTCAWAPHEKQKPRSSIPSGASLSVLVVGPDSDRRRRGYRATYFLVSSDMVRSVSVTSISLMSISTVFGHNR